MLLGPLLSGFHAQPLRQREGGGLTERAMIRRREALELLAGGIVQADRDTGEHGESVARWDSDVNPRFGG